MTDAERPRPRLLIVDDEAYFVQFFTSLFEGRDVEVESAATGRQGLELLERKRYDLIVVDLQLPDMQGLEILDWLRERNVSTPSVMVTAYGTIEVAVQAMKKGAVDFFTKPLENPHVFVRFLTRTLEIGQTPEQATMNAAQKAATQLARGLPPEKDSASELERVRAMCLKLDANLELTRRECEVISALLRGLSNKEIASSLYITERTVKNHLTQIYKKFHVDSRSQIFNRILVGLE